MNQFDEARSTLQLVTESPLGERAGRALLARALFALSECARSQLLVDQSEQLLRRCLRVDASLLPVRMMLAEALRQRRDVHAATLMLTEACRVCAEDADRTLLGECHYMLAEMQQSLGLVGEAIKHFRWAGQLHFMPLESFRSAGNLLLSLKNYTEAIPLLEQAAAAAELDQHRGDAKTLNMLGVARAATSDVAGAELAWKRSAEICRSGATLANLGAVAQCQGDPKFISLYQESLPGVLGFSTTTDTATTGPSSSSSVASDGIDSRPLKKIRGSAEQSSASARSNVLLTIYNNTAVEFLKRNMLGCAHEALQAAHELNPKNPQMLYNLGLVYASQRHYADAIPLELVAATTHLQQFPEAQNNLGVCLHRTGRLNMAMQSYRKAADLDPANDRFKLNIARVLLDQNDLSACESELEKLPNSAGKYALQSGVALRRGEFETARKAAKQSVKLEETSEGLYCLGFAYHKLGRLEDAKHVYTRLLYFDPNHPWASFALGSVHYDQENYTKAVAEYNKMITINAGFWPGVLSLAHAYAKLGRAREAIASYKRCTELDPRNAEAYYGWGNVLLVNKQVEGALKCFRIAASLAPKNLEILMHTAILQEHFGNVEEAAQHLDACVRLVPDDPNLSCALAFLHGTRGMSNRAVEWFEKVRSMAPDHPCVAWFDKAVAVDPGLQRSTEYFPPALPK